MTAMKELTASLSVAQAPTAEAAVVAAHRMVVPGVGTGINANVQVAASTGAPKAVAARQELDAASRATIEMSNIAEVEKEARDRLTYMNRSKNPLTHWLGKEGEKRGNELTPSNADSLSEQDNQSDDPSGSSSRGASRGGDPSAVPPGAEPFRGGEVPAWMGQARTTNNPLSMPRFGEWTPQELLQRGSAYFGKKGQQKFGQQVSTFEDEGMDRQKAQEQANEMGSGNFTGNVSAALGKASEYTVQTAVMGHLGDKVQSGFAKLGVDSREGSNASLGEQMGYGTSQLDIPGFGYVPVPKPLQMFDPRAIPLFGGEMNAAQKGLETQIKAQWGGREFSNLSSQRRNDIVTTGIQAGYKDGAQLDKYKNTMMGALSGDKALEALSTDKVQALYDQDLRHNNSADAINKFKESIQGIPESANAARMNVDEFAGAMAEMGEFFTNEIGGTAAQAKDFSHQFAASTGQDPRIAQTLLQSPMVEGMISQQTGLRPNQFGALPSSVLIGSTYDALKQTEKLYEGSGPRTVEYEMGGETFTKTETGKQAAEAQAAQEHGIGLDQYRSMMRDAKKSVQRSETLDMAKTNKDQRADGIRTGKLDKVGKVAHGGITQDGIVSNKELTKSMYESGFSKKQVADVYKLAPGGDRYNKIHSITSQMTNKDKTNPKEKAASQTKVKIELGMSDEARRWVKEINRKVSTAKKAQDAQRDGKTSVNPTDGDQVKHESRDDLMARFRDASQESG